MLQYRMRKNYFVKYTKARKRFNTNDVLCRLKRATKLNILNTTNELCFVIFYILYMN